MLSGHFHGLGQITTEDAGGMEGHTVVELLADYQEFRTHTGERATGSTGMLQLDIAPGTVAVDTFSVRLGRRGELSVRLPAVRSRQRARDHPGQRAAVADRRGGLQHRYTVEDDEFTVRVAFQYDKSVETTGLTIGD